jgi:hypothetical protein
MKNNINKSNYEIYAIDYIENNLSDELKTEFEEFLKQNPSIREEMDILDINFRDADYVVFDNKHLLKKAPIDGISYVDYLMISDIEGIISKSEKAELTEIISLDTKNKKDYELFKKTKLSNITIPFLYKNSLKHSNTFSYKKILYFAIPAAAILVLYFGLNISNYKKEKAMICKNNTELNFTRQIKFKEQQNNIIIEDINNYNYVVKNNNTFNNKNNNQNIVEEEIYIPTIATNEYEVEEKQIYTKLSNIEKVCYPNNYSIQSEQVYIANNDNNGLNIIQKVKKTKAQDFVDFVVKQYNSMTESELSVKVDVNKESKCFVLEVNDKDYNICLR